MSFIRISRIILDDVIIKLPAHDRSATRLIFTEIQLEGANGFKLTGEIDMATVQMNRGQKVILGVKPTAADGGPGNYLKGSAKWSDPDAAIDIEPVPGDEQNELRRQITAKDAIANSLVTVTLDPDPADTTGTESIVGTCAFVINQPNATTVDIEPEGPPA